METRRTISALIALAFVLTPFIAVAWSSPTAKALETKEGDVSKTKEGWSELNLVWDQNAVGKPYTMNLSLNKGWSLETATIGVSGEPLITDPGTEWEETTYPERPRLDVGRDGDDWEWPGVFGVYYEAQTPTKNAREGGLIRAEQERNHHADDLSLLRASLQRMK